MKTTRIRRLIVDNCPVLERR